MSPQHIEVAEGAENPHQNVALKPYRISVLLPHQGAGHTPACREQRRAPVELPAQTDHHAAEHVPKIGTREPAAQINEDSVGRKLYTEHGPHRVLVLFRSNVEIVSDEARQKHTEYNAPAGQRAYLFLPHAREKDSRREQKGDDAVMNAQCQIVVLLLCLFSHKSPGLCATVFSGNKSTQQTNQTTL